MNKLQFLEVLSEKLSEDLPRSVVLSNLEYYEHYIDGEVAKGRFADEVMDELGDPYMIARTIIDTHTGEAFEDQKYTEEAVYTDPVGKEPTQQTDKTVVKGDYGCLIAAILIVLVVVVVLSLLGSVISFLWPILGPVLLILFVVSIFRNKGR